jgi:hypothetical protein
MHERLAVYVSDPDAPADAARTVAHIDRGSGIVGKRIVEADPAESPLLVYYEGNRYGAENMRLYAERVYHAASRMQEDYPTVATSVVRRDALLHVGWWYPEHRRVEISGAQVPEGRALYRIADWIGQPLEEGPDLSRELRLPPKPMTMKEALEAAQRRAMGRP